MTKCPRKISEIEAVMAGAPWPIDKASIYLENGREQV
jgi:Xaa-Pro dipeptidase